MDGIVKKNFEIQNILILFPFGKYFNSQVSVLFLGNIYVYLCRSIQ